jgi:hypothetical protein
MRRMHPSLGPWERLPFPWNSLSWSVSTIWPSVAPAEWHCSKRKDRYLQIQVRDADQSGARFPLNTGFPLNTDPLKEGQRQQGLGRPADRASESHSPGWTKAGTCCTYTRAACGPALTDDASIYSCMHIYLREDSIFGFKTFFKIS